MLNVAPAMAPVCVNVALNAAPTVPAVVPGFVTLIVWQLMVRLYVAAVPVQPFASVTVTTIGKVLCCRVVPESRPEDDSVMPVGSVEAVENVTAPWPPVCVNCSLNGAFTVPVVLTGFVTVIV